jgi:hypothetical protein
MRKLKNLGFWITVLLCGAAGVGIGIAETEIGLTHATLVFQMLGLFGVIYFVTAGFIMPFRYLKVTAGGFILSTPDTHKKVQWVDVTEILVFKEGRQLEWMIKTKQSDLICIMDYEELYRRRLRKGAKSHLHGFDDAAFQEAVDSRVDGSWKCYSIQDVANEDIVS